MPSLRHVTLCIQTVVHMQCRHMYTLYKIYALRSSISYSSTEESRRHLSLFTYNYDQKCLKLTKKKKKFFCRLWNDSDFSIDSSSTLTQIS